MENWKLWINGEWTDAARSYELKSPYSQEPVATIAKADAEDVKRAIEGAHEAFLEFRKWPAYERAELLYRAVDLIEARREELAGLLVKEAGKPIKTALGEIDRTIATYQFSAEAAKSMYGETVPMDAAPGVTDRIGWTKREALGVVSAITPFNFPSNLVAHKLGPAFAVGNTVVLKPATQTPLSSLALAEIFKEAGLPDGALQIVTGSGSELSEPLITNDLVKKVTFTGSVPVGLDIKSKVGLKKMTLELGSNSALIVEPDVPLEKIMPRAVTGAFGFAGQVCISLQRVYVHESIYDEFVDLFVKETEKLRVGDPADESTDVGSMIHPGEADRAMEWIEQAKQAGATVSTGGERIQNGIAPTVMTDVTPDMNVVCMEVFAPIVTIMKYSDLDEAIDLVNDSQYGLNAGIYTRDIEAAMKAADEIEAGAVIINDIPTFRTDNMPYGGVKMSGYGREGVKYAIEGMTEMKFITMKTII
ncbi:aldehyde dehydrogenase family protein [Edaphobacillus lindanitolerans]|uniref:3-sulfolactaldehyde dehydrogenase n=1 Tax=Edaphobacillus lindanitolerans TaxID=550447 RepID=A0A1U7PKZ4_9BACI|nr:aldehyde dehydrogenase family protein [Edaphobacillus lindanitolerans]SIT87181.1 Acyl-CoA reductase [Edaphobacillus lindanitolerans]